jgi:hypothetical protein
LTSALTGEVFVGDETSAEMGCGQGRRHGDRDARTSAKKQALREGGAAHVHQEDDLVAEVMRLSGGREHSSSSIRLPDATSRRWHR